MIRFAVFAAYAGRVLTLSDQKTKAILFHMAQVWLRLAVLTDDPGTTLKDEQPGESLARRNHNNGAALPDGSKATTKKQF